MKSNKSRDVLSGFVFLTPNISKTASWKQISKSTLVSLYLSLRKCPMLVHQKENRESSIKITKRGHHLDCDVSID